MENNKIKISLIVNLIIFVLTVTASIMMFTGFRFMEGGYVLESTAIGMFRFFTVDSNIFMGIVALLFALKEIELLKGKTKKISIKMYILKLMATVGVTLTCLTVFAYLGPITEGGVAQHLKNSNLFLHLIIPVLSILNFIIFERTTRLKFKYTLYGVIPALIYAIYYLINCLIHIENGKISTEYDWYWFVQGGLWQIVIVLPLMLGVTYVLSTLLWRANKINSRGERQWKN